MSQQISGIKAKALAHEQEVFRRKNQGQSGLKKLAERNQEQYFSKWRREDVLNSAISTNMNELIQNKISPDNEKNVAYGKNIIGDKTKRNEKNGLPSPYQCAELLKEKVYFICYDRALYYFNGRCYDLLSSDDIIRLYRDKVDVTMGYERNLNIFNHVFRTLSTDSSIRVEQLSRDNRVAVLRNGIFDVEYQKLREHSHKEIVFSYIDADYVKDEECPNFDNFIYDITNGDKLLQKRFWMFLGYILMQSMEAKAFFVMGEAPDSGKSLLGNFIESLFPSKYVSNIALNDMNKGFSVAPIAGSAINISLDLPSVRLNASAVSKLKMLTGGDTFNINQKYEKEYRYENRAKLIFASNFPIHLVEDDNAFWNRLVYLPFTKSVPKCQQDKKLLKKLQNEKNAIVSKALYYAKKLIENDFQFPSTSYIECKMMEWQGKSCKSVESFLGDCCFCGAEYEGELLETLYLSYEQYCKYTDYVAISKNEFKKFLEEQKGLKHCKKRFGGGNPRSAFEGIMIRDTADSLQAESLISALHDEFMS